MSTNPTQDFRYPIGPYQAPETFSDDIIRSSIIAIQQLPALLRESVRWMSTAQLDTPYREGGWTVRQVIHHMADSHMNSYTRFKLALTEENPVIKPYNEKLWAELPDSRTAPVELSLQLLEVLHQRWVMLLKSLGKEELARTFVHPAQNREIRLDEAITMYAWHCRHHLAHITSLKQRMEW
jgi:uncharacterized damage-inducible protein DinB